jgi:hypothetical protein
VPFGGGSYEIRVKGRLGDSLLAAFEGLTATVEPVETVLHGPFRGGGAGVAVTVLLQTGRDSPSSPPDCSMMRPTYARAATPTGSCWTHSSLSGRATTAKPKPWRTGQRV